jgi:radical SAM superfamily enzyme YgiQ (UPF0313 family)
MVRRVLMINPPALVTSIWQLIQYPEPYPYGLLKLGALLKRQGRGVELVDMMEYEHQTDAFFRAFPQNLVRHSTKHAGSRHVRGEERPAYYLGRTPAWLAEELERHRRPDEVWVTCCLSYNYEPAHEVVAVVKKRWPKVKVKLGGIYPTLMPELAATAGADEVVRGKIEAAEALFGDYSLYATAPRVGIYSFATGCRNRCSFCINHHFPFTPRHTPEEIALHLADLRARLGIRHFSNWDPNVLLCERELARLLDLVAERGLDCTLSFDMGLQANRLTLPLARKMRRAGVHQVTVPFDSADPAMLRRLRKPYRADAPLAAFARLREAGFAPGRLHSCSFFAIDGEEPRYLYRTYFAIIGAGVRPIFSPFSPVPSSAEWARVAHLIEGKPHDEINGYLFPVIDSAEQVRLYERLIELFHTYDLRRARALAAGLPAAHQRIFDEELDRAQRDLRQRGAEFHLPADEAADPWRHEAPEVAAARLFPGPRCPLCGAQDRCRAAGRVRDEYPACEEPLRGTPPKRVRALLAWCARQHRLRDPRLAATTRVLLRRFARDDAAFANIFDPSASWDADGWHLYRYTYEFPGYAGDRAGVTRALLELCAPFGDRMVSFATRLLRLAAAPCVTQVLYGLAYDGPERFRVKLYLQFADGADAAALELARRAVGRADVGAAAGGRELHLLGVDLGPRGLTGAKLYLRHPRVRLADAAQTLGPSPLLADLAAAGVTELRDVLAIHRLRRRADPAAGAPAEIDFGLRENDLDFGALRALPSLRPILSGADALAELERRFRIAVRRVSVPAGRLDKLNLYYVLAEPGAEAAA